MGAYRKKPVVVEARQLTEDNTVELADWVSDNGTRCNQFLDPAYLEIVTLEGFMRADPGDWIIQGVHGEFYPCKPAIFEATYEPAGEPADTPVVTQSIGYIPGSKPEGLTIAPEVTERLAEAGKVIADREDLRAVLDGGFFDEDTAGAHDRLAAAVGDAR